MRCCGTGKRAGAAADKRPGAGTHSRGGTNNGAAAGPDGAAGERPVARRITATGKGKRQRCWRDDFAQHHDNSFFYMPNNVLSGLMVFNPSRSLLAKDGESLISH
jgi:hypothetical protein